MPFGYIGQNQPKQKVKNAGVLSSFDISLLEKNNHASGSYELIQSQTASADAALNFTEIRGSEFDVHYVTFNEIKDFSSSGVNFGLRFYESGTLETDSVYQGAHIEQKSSNQNYNPKGTYSYIFLSQGSLTTNEYTSGYCYIYYANKSDEYTYVTDHVITEDPAGTAVFSYGGGVLPQTSTVDGLNFSTVNGATMNGVINLYGVKKQWVL